MKKILALILAMMLVLALFSACSTETTEGPDESGQITDDNQNTDDMNTPDEGEDEENTPDAGNDGEDEGNTPDVGNDGEDEGNTPDAGNNGEDEGNTPDTGNDETTGNDSAVLSGALSEIIDKIYENKPLDLMLATRDIDLTNADDVKYNTGLDNADLISEASVSETMIGSQAYSMVLVRVKNAEDAQSVAESMKNGINPNKWVCVGADDLRVVAYGDLVLLVMIDSEFADLATADELCEAFGVVCGAEFDVDLQ